MGWEADGNYLSHIALLLDNASLGNTAKQLEIQKALNDYQKKLPDFACYLVHIFCSDGAFKENVQVISGLVLKNYLNAFHRLVSTEINEMVKRDVFKAFHSKHHLVRATAGTVLSMIVDRSAPELVPAILLALLKELESQSQSVQEAAIGSFRKICEDHPEKVEKCPGNPLNHLLPRFIDLMGNSVPAIRCNAINCIIPFIRENCQEFPQQLGGFMNALSARADSDTNPEVRKCVCKALVSLMDSFKSQIAQSLPYIYQYVLKAVQDEDLSVSLEACEFWLAASEIEDLLPGLSTLFPSLIPVLMKNMKYDDSDPLFMDYGDDQDLEDKDEDIKPRHHRTRMHDGAGSTAADDDDDEDEAEDSYREWNLRKCSAAAIDSLSYCNQKSQYLQVFLPMVNQKLCSQDWLELESGILALGAVSEGLRESMEPHLPQLLPFLFKTLVHPKPLVRSITCWTLSRYCTWVVQCYDDTNLKSGIFIPYLEGILNCMLDRSKKVQEAACSAFTTFAAEAIGILSEYLPGVLEIIGKAFQKYKRKNIILLYEIIQTLCDTLQGALNNEIFVSRIMTSLMSEINTMNFQDRRFFSYYECLGSIASALEFGFSPFAQVCFARSLAVISEVQQAYAMISHNPTQQFETPEKDYMVVAIDLIGNIVQSMRESLLPILSSHQEVFYRCLGNCLVDSDCDVRQSSFGLVGDLAQHCFGFLEPQIKSILPEVFKNMVPNDNPPKLIVTLALASNAVWALGEIALHNGSYIEPFCQPILANLILFLNVDQRRSDLPPLSENAAITLGRVSKACPLLVAPHLPQFIEKWCFCLTKVRILYEKQTAFEGLCDLIMVNARGVIRSFPFICHAFVAFDRPPQLLEERFKKILLGYKDLLGSDWVSFMQQNESAVLREVLLKRFGIQ